MLILYCSYPRAQACKTAYTEGAKTRCCSGTGEKSNKDATMPCAVTKITCFTSAAEASEAECGTLTKLNSQLYNESFNSVRPLPRADSGNLESVHGAGHLEKLFRG